MSRAWEWIKQHPWITGGIVALVLLWIFWPRRAATSDAGSGVPSEAIAAGAQVQIAHDATNAATAQAQIQADAARAIAESSNSAALGVAQSTNATALGIANVQAGMTTSLGNLALQGQQFQAATDVVKAGIAAQTTTNLAAASLAAQHDELVAKSLYHAIDVAGSGNEMYGSGGVAAFAAKLANLQAFVAGTPYKAVNFPGLGAVTAPDTSRPAGTVGGLAAPASLPTIDLAALLARLPAIGHT